MSTSRVIRGVLCGLAVAAAGVLARPTAARADQFVDRANDAYKGIQGDKRSDEVLLPLLAKMDEPPVHLSDMLQAALMPPAAADFAKLATWSQAEPQKALLEALKKVTAEEGRGKTFEFAQPYGAVQANPDLVIAGMYTELGDPPLLAQADIKWLPRMRTFLAMLQIEATRLAAAGTPKEALDLLVRTAFFGRQLANRVLMREKVLGFDTMTVALMRMRDIAWGDFRSGQPKLTAENMRDVIARLKDREGVLSIDRIDLPVGDQWAAEQLLSRIMTAGAEVDADNFAATLARIAARDRPMRLFSEQAKWRALAKLHAGQTETQRKLADVFGDWQARWKMNPWDPLLKTRSEFARLSKTRFAAIGVFLGDLGTLFDRRMELRVELVGTRTALAHYGFWLQTRGFAPDSTGLRPAFLTGREVDPFDPSGSLWLPYFVPGRQAGGQTVPGATHEMEIFPSMAGRTFPQFAITVNDDTFVLYSMGPKASRATAKRITQMVPDNKGDYLLWPPMLTLERQDQERQGMWK